MIKSGKLYIKKYILQNGLTLRGARQEMTESSLYPDSLFFMARVPLIRTNSLERLKNVCNRWGVVTAENHFLKRNVSASDGFPGCTFNKLFKMERGNPVSSIV